LPDNNVELLTVSILINSIKYLSPAINVGQSVAKMSDFYTFKVVKITRPVKMTEKTCKDKKKEVAKCKVRVYKAIMRMDKSIYCTKAVRQAYSKKPFRPWGCSAVKVLKPNGSIKKIIELSEIKSPTKKQKKARLKIVANSREGKRYHNWRTAVLTRDHYKCVLCSDNHRIEAHHIERWVDKPSLRFNVQNGVALCYNCHQQYHNHNKEKFPIKITNILKQYVALKYKLIKVIKRKNEKVAENVVAR
jgi:5-methylcytosine-specific restriction endonuclease McrA